MRASPAMRKGILALHVIASLGWMGAVAAFIVLDATTVASDDAPTLRAAYVGMELVTDWAIVPLAVAALATGILISLVTTWGLFRHWWVVVSLRRPGECSRLPFGCRPGLVQEQPAGGRGMGKAFLHDAAETVL
ncbi:MAG: hypothetical protein LC620_02955, partial [Halobacteriales archaeon]|nr:hypothetical protein [Halobacteriales archaeon]